VSRLGEPRNGRSGDTRLMLVHYRIKRTDWDRWGFLTEHGLRGMYWLEERSLATSFDLGDALAAIKEFELQNKTTVRRCCDDYHRAPPLGS
jgi:hypothetical protein